MKFLIYLCCIAHLLSMISARLRLTTPLSSALHLNDAARNIAEIIDIVNSAYNNDGRSIARREPMLRRYVFPAVKGTNLPPSVVVPNEEDTQNQLENLADTVRYQVIDNPEVLEQYSNKQKQKNNEELLKPVSVVSDTSAETKSFSTLDKKLKYYHSMSNSTGSHTSTNNNKFDEFLHTFNPNPLDSVQELTTIESTTYRPSFPDDDDDDDDIQVSITEKEITTPIADTNNHDDLKINNTVEIEMKTLDNKDSSKEDQARIEEEKAPKEDTKETDQMKHELSIKKDNNTDDDEVIVGVTVNEEKSGSKKEYISSKLDYNNNERPSEDNVRTREQRKTNTRTRETSSEKVMGRKYKSALRNIQEKNNYDFMEHSIYADKEINENSNKQFGNRYEKRDEYHRKKKR